MNRKQRRAAERSGAKRASDAHAGPQSGLTQTSLFQAALAAHQSGALVEAERRYRQILSDFPGHAESHAMLGAALMAQRKTADAISHFEQSVALNPDLAGGHEMLARAYLEAGKPDLAIAAASRALERKETPQTKALFAHSIASARCTTDNPQIRRMAARAVAEGWTRPRALTGTCISLIKLDPILNDAIVRSNAAWPVRLSAMDLFSASAMAALAGNELLCRLLECDPITDIGLERLLTNIRRGLLAISATVDECDEATLAFYCALARQCFINEYVFSLTDSEAEQVRSLRGLLEQSLATDGDCAPLRLAAAGTYFPLHVLPEAQGLLKRSWPPCVNALLVQQIKEPAEERRIGATIPALTRIDDEVSRAVRNQYEENPYPRWINAGPPTAPLGSPARQPAQVFDALIAGCGTGLSAVDFARQAPSARILAIDLSLASLSYAKRMALNLGIANVEFAQADIMRLDSIGRQFDLIDSSGVLHHLADPWAGWRILLSLLRPGGSMQVGLYSELARKNIVAARMLIAERGYRASLDDIRRCREHLIASADPLLRSMIQWEDFFSTSECRDLLFHVQEHRTTLPDIKAFLAANGLGFVRFNLDAPALHRFAARFPDARAMSDLDCWHTFETEAPLTFASMYQFWVRKLDAPLEQAAAGSLKGTQTPPQSQAASAADAGSTGAP